MKKRPLALVAGLSASILAATTFTPAFAAGSTTPQKGGTLIYALPPQTNINWYLPISNAANASTYNEWLISQMYPNLIYVDNGYNIDYDDSLANNVSYNKAGTVYTISLKNNWKWSDGQPVTANDIVFAYNVIKATDTSQVAPWPNYNAGAGDVPTNVKSVVATNKYTVTITLDKAMNQQWFIYNGIGQLMAMPEHAWNKYPTNMAKEIAYLGKNATNPKFFTVVDGPFKLQSAVPNQSWTMVPNPTFGGHKSTLDKLVFEYEASSDAEFAALKTGAVNLGYLTLAQYGSKDALTSQGDTITPLFNFGYYFTELNLLKGSPLYSAFNDLKVRQALQEGIDENTIDNEIYHGFAPAQYGAIPELPKTIFYDPKLAKPVYPFSISNATKLLESDGWKMQNGVMTKNGQQLKFTLLVAEGNDTTTLEAELIQQDWKKMGVVVTLKPEPFDNIESAMSNSKEPGAWAAAIGTGITYGGSYPSGEQLFEPGGLDNFGYNDATENKLIAKTIAPVSSQTQWKKDFFAYEEYTAKQLPVLWNNMAAHLSVAAPNVHNANSKYLNWTVESYPLLNYIWMSK